MRRNTTTAAAGVLFTAALSFGFAGTAHAADRDCPDFPSQAAAQAAYDAVPGDPERLDGDDDGVACEDYAYAPASSTTGTQAGSTGGATTGGAQVATRPAGAVAAGDGSASGDDASALPYVLGGVALTAAGGAAFAARRSSRATV
ncbi:Excalibur calcium-binding domain-containing protein [Geodermatophilus saharensis]|uniref:Excalibur calcium-binding domain-containing protein n=1 Tax=Geodermatophilus saharensis TaxID=1137994 RepID=A0A239BNC4_9ACTN|nr:excalibur calcium-binding domain-containing protein [Geodermatophilus saharensis]SNS09637.1 Excalibur calcium-binding domain-containing protein [Geodermatophilus saharensis]